MNIFVLNTGRCGSTTFIKACQHITNFTSAHESRIMLLGDARFQYPENHIEADNRLSWLLGRLDRYYGKDAMYVHLKRNDHDTAQSFVKRYSVGIVAAYRHAVHWELPESNDAMSVSLDYCDTVNSNIELFLKDKPDWMSFSLENAKVDFRKFWEMIGAEGNLESALLEFDIAYNASKRPRRRLIARTVRRILRIGKKSLISQEMPDEALHLTAIPLRSIAAGEL